MNPCEPERPVFHPQILAAAVACGIAKGENLALVSLSDREALGKIIDDAARARLAEVDSDAEDAFKGWPGSR